MVDYVEYLVSNMRTSTIYENKLNKVLELSVILIILNIVVLNNNQKWRYQ